MTTVTIQARDFWTDVCPVRAGETYRLAAAGRWRDWFVPCGPQGYSTVLLAPLAHRRRAPDAAWFCLMGAIDRDEPSAFPIGAGRTWTAPKSGLLACFANDLPKMYWNNRGALTLTVEPLATSGTRRASSTASPSSFRAFTFPRRTSSCAARAGPA